MKKNYYITTPIYYVNDVPHIGHAYTSIASDVIARFKRLSGNDVFFLTGTDEHGQKVQKSAEKQAIEPQKFVDKNAEIFKNLMVKANISNDDFIRTTEERHKIIVELIWNKLLDSGNIYKGKYAGWYALRDEAFYNESELVNGVAPTGAEVTFVEEESYFFSLSKWQDKLLEFYEKNPDFIYPKTRRNEVISFVKSGLTDLSISRTSFNWGIKVPNDSKHVIYVWLDALTNYLSASYDNDILSPKKWPCDVHVVGKDILRFHAIYWPAFLMAANIELPKTIIAHGWWTNDGQKISKSVGNVIDPIKLMDEFGVDQVRYFLMKEMIFGNDGNYSRTALIHRVNSELANKIGNLMHRSLSLIYAHNGEIIPIVNVENIYKLPMIKMAEKFVIDNINFMDKFEINKIMDNIISLAEEGNIFMDYNAPWSLKNTDKKKMMEILYGIAELLRYISIMLLPFIPTSANLMLDNLSIKMNERSFKYLNIDYALKANKLNKPQIIFKKFEIL